MKKQKEFLSILVNE